MMSFLSRSAGRAGALVVLLVPGLAVACALPAPDGPHAVGVQRFELIDSSRHGMGGEGPEAPRTLPALVWYPAEPGTDAHTYLTPAEAEVQMPALARNLRYAPGDVAGLGACGTHSGAGAAPVRGNAPFPLVVLSHGFYLHPAQNTALAESLASQGHVVVAIGHPGDSVDVRLADGRLVPTNTVPEKPDFLAWRSAFHSAGTDAHATRAALLDTYAQALDGSRLGDSVAAWRDDVLFTVQALRAGQVPAPVAPILEGADPTRLALVGMSFGGSTVATACRLIETCRAAVSLDGQNFDPALFDADVGRPLLVLLADWARFPLYDGLPSDASFNPNDYAYERWTQAGLSPDVVRVWVPGTRHMSFSDLPLLMDLDDPEAQFGDADPIAVARAIATVSRAFLEVHLGTGDPAGLARVIEAAGVVRHDPASTRDWARARGDRPRAAGP